MNTTRVKFSPALWLTFVLLLCNLSAIARPQEKIKRKEISQSYSVSSSDRLQVENRFGNITLTHWNKNEVAIRVEIECKARSEEHAQENLDRIQIETKKTGGIVSAITTIKERKGNSNNESMTINYYIQMPPKLSADLNQKYGNINLPSDNNGKMDIHLKYGNLNAGNFTANTMIEAKYGNIEVGNLQDALLDLGYVGTAKIGDAKELTIDSKYSNLDLQDIQSLRMEIKYGNLSIESVSRLDMEIKYSDAKIGTLKDALNVSSLSYSNLKIRNLSRSFSKVNVESHYGNLEVGLPARTSFRVVAENMKYSSCDVNGFNITRKHFDDEDHDKNYTYEINGGKQPTIYF
ncbi:MAG: hypothetical protein PHC95_15380 [Parabacteroides sp.]|nr:hypothetical protein [Parabacteroides sp.]